MIHLSWPVAAVPACPGPFRKARRRQNAQREAPDALGPVHVACPPNYYARRSCQDRSPAHRVDEKRDRAGHKSCLLCAIKSEDRFSQQSTEQLIRRTGKKGGGPMEEANLEQRFPCGGEKGLKEGRERSGHAVQRPQRQGGGRIYDFLCGAKRRWRESLFRYGSDHLRHRWRPHHPVCSVKRVFQPAEHLDTPPEV